MAKPKKERSSLLDAMIFLLFAQTSKGNEQMQHCIVSGHSAVAFDGLLACGTPVVEDLEACPNTAVLEMALEQCGQTFSLTQLPDNRLLLRSGDFQAFIPCADPSRLTSALPDAAVMAVDEKLTGALALAGTLASDKADKVYAASVQLNSCTVRGCTREIIIEAWHGFDGLPNGLLIPKQAVIAVTKSKKQLVGIGGSEKTITFWFEDQSWIRTQLYEQGGWPDVERILNAGRFDEKKIPTEFWSAFKAVAMHSVDDHVYCEIDSISSHPKQKEAGANFSLQVAGAPQMRIFSIKALKQIKNYCETFSDNDFRTFRFYGKAGEIHVRGALACSPILAPCKVANCEGCDNCF